MPSKMKPCPACGSPECSELEDNCPICLLHLGVAVSFREATAETPVRRTLGDYELLEEIARGGMGIVYRARQRSLKRDVAVKILAGGFFANANFARRFRREAELAASLNHPNIVAIHEVGEHEGQLYFSMELIEGRNLAEAIRNKEFSSRQAAEVIKTVAEAVAFAHDHGLLHRDLKPSNILLDGDNFPHVSDFGLAKRSDGDHDLTVTGQIIGSPNYMAPEQADAAFGPTTAASDVYSLGAMLYHALTGRPPFVADSIAQTLRLVTESKPVPPRLLNPEVSRDLETICLKCLETEPARRYASAQELAADLGRFLNDQPIRARAVGKLGAVARWSRRNPALAGTIGFAAVLLLTVAIGSPIALVRIQRERERSAAAEREARRQLYTALLEQAHASVRSAEIGQRVNALDAVRRAASISNSAALRGEAMAALSLPDLRFDRSLPFTSGVTLQAIDPEFQRIALCRGAGPVEITDLAQGTVQFILPASTNLPAYVARWSADRRYLAVKRDYPPSGFRADLEVWDIPARQLVLLLHDQIQQSFSFHPTLPRLITSQTGRVIIWNLEDATPIKVFEDAAIPEAVEFSPEGERVAALFARRLLSIHDPHTGEMLSSNRFTADIKSFTWHPQGTWLAVTDSDGNVHSMMALDGATRRLGSHKAEAVTGTFTPDGDFLFSGGWEGELICWNARTLERAFTIGKQSWRMQIASGGRRCALLTRTRIDFYTLERPFCRDFPEDLGPRLRHAAFSPDGNWLAASAEQFLGVWDLRNPSPAMLAGDISDARLHFADNSLEVFASSAKERIGRWRIQRDEIGGVQLQKMPPPTAEHRATLSVTGGSIAITTPRGSSFARLDESGGELPYFRTPFGINGVSPDANWLGIFPPYSSTLEVYALPEARRAAALSHSDSIADFAFSPFTGELAVSTRGGVVFWSTNSWSRTRTLTNFIGILFTSERSSWWLTRDFRRGGLYDSQTMEQLLPLPSGTLPLALSTNGRHLAVSVNMRSLQLWDLPQLRHQLRELGLDW